MEVELRGAGFAAECFEFVADVEVEVSVEVFLGDSVLCAVANYVFDGPAVDRVR